MANRFDEFHAAVSEASKVILAADNVADKMARLLRGRHRHVAPHVLVGLKRELKGFNARTMRWS